MSNEKRRIKRRQRTKYKSQGAATPAAALGLSTQLKAAASETFDQMAGRFIELLSERK